MYINFIIVLLVVSMTESKRILGVYPVPSVSHQKVFRPVMRSLANLAHEIVVITPNPVFSKGQAPQNYTELDIHDVSYGTLKDSAIFDNKLKASDSFKVAFKICSIAFARMNSTEVQSLIKNKSVTFDLVFIESVSRPSLGFTHLYNVPVIEFSSLAGQFDVYEDIGAATNALLYPLVQQQRIYNLTFWEKISEIYKGFKCVYDFNHLGQEDEKIIKNLFDANAPAAKELRKNIHMSFFNVNPIWDSNRPVPPSVIYLGGLHQKPFKQLPKDIQDYLDNSKNGVIYVSFGTNILPSLLYSEKVNILTNVFSQLPYDVLLKWDKKELPHRPKNVKISTWFPQSDLLQHPKIRLFIMQGGLQSTDEAITAGVPLICIPMLWDQPFNCEQCVKHGIGIPLNFEILTEEKLIKAINTITENQKCYRDNVLKLRSIMEDQPQTPLERAVWWTEYVLRHGGAKHLQSPAANMHWTEYYELELVSYSIGTLLSMIIVTIIIIHRIIILCRCIKSKLRDYIKIKMN